PDKPGRWTRRHRAGRSGPDRRRLAQVNDKLVWIDCEMTGLDPVNDALIEVAALVTNFDLEVLGEGVDVVITPPAAAVRQMDKVVRGMHTRSGLLDQLDGGMDMASAEQA